MNNNRFLCTLYKNNRNIYEQEFNNENQALYEFNMLDFKTILDIKQETFIRENNEYKFFLDIKNKACLITLKQENLTFDILVEEVNLLVLNNKIVLEYFIETDEERTKIIIKKKEDLYE